MHQNSARNWGYHEEKAGKLFALLELKSQIIRNTHMKVFNFHLHWDKMSGTDNNWLKHSSNCRSWCQEVRESLEVEWWVRFRARQHPRLGMRQCITQLN